MPGSAACCRAGVSAKAKRLGASAAKLLVYYHPDAPTRRTRSGSSPTSLPPAARHDLALFLEPLSFGLDGGKLGPARTDGASSSRPRGG